MTPRTAFKNPNKSLTRETYDLLCVVIDLLYFEGAQPRTPDATHHLDDMYSI